MTGNSNGLHTGWTPGPWALDGGSCEHGVSAVTTDHEGRHTRRSTVVMLCDYSEPGRLEKVWMADNWRKDAALIALAPEMANLLLSMPIYPGTTHHIWAEALRLQDKLRTLKDST